MRAKEENLPIEIWQLIMAFATAKDRCNFELVCKLWRAVASADLTWEMATSTTKEQCRLQSFQYTIVTISNLLENQIVLRNHYKLDEQELRHFFSNDAKLSSAFWSEDLGLSIEGVVCKNRTFNMGEQGIIDAIVKAKREAWKNNNILSKDEQFIIKYRKRGGQIHLFELKHLFAAEVTVLKEPIIFASAKLKNFPSAEARIESLLRAPSLFPLYNRSLDAAKPNQGFPSIQEVQYSHFSNENIG